MPNNNATANASNGVESFGLFLLILGFVLIGLLWLFKKVRAAGSLSNLVWELLAKLLPDPIQSEPITIPITIPQPQVTHTVIGTVTPSQELTPPTPLSLEIPPRPAILVVAEQQQQPLTPNQIMFEGKVVTIPEWFPMVMEDFVHMMIIGSTKAGKSTFVNAMLRKLAGLGEIVLIDPHIRFHWPIDVVGWGKNYDAISHSFKYLLEEMDRRFDFANAARENEAKLKPLYIIIDEWGSINEALGKDAPAFMRIMAQEVRKIKMHIIVLNQSDLVEALGIKGNGKVRDNFITIYLGLEAMDMCKDYYVKLKEKGLVEEWPCVFAIGKNLYPANRGFIHALSQQPMPPYTLFEIPNLPKKGVLSLAAAKKELQASSFSAAALEEDELPETVAKDFDQPLVLLKPEPADDKIRQHLQAMLIVQQKPESSVRDVARAIFDRDYGGSDVTKAKLILWEIYRDTGLTIEKLKSEFEEKKQAVSA